MKLSRTVRRVLKKAWKPIVLFGKKKNPGKMKELMLEHQPKVQTLQQHLQGSQIFHGILSFFHTHPSTGFFKIWRYFAMMVFVSLMSIAGALSLQYALAQTAWTGPTATPPGNNVAAPVNVGATAQTKAGGLTVEGVLYANGSIYVDSGKTLNGLGYFSSGNVDGRRGVQIGSGTMVIDASKGENLIYGNMDQTSSGNLLLLQKEFNSVFRAHGNAQIGTGTSTLGSPAGAQGIFDTTGVGTLATGQSIGGYFENQVSNGEKSSVYLGYRGRATLYDKNHNLLLDNKPVNAGLLSVVESDGSFPGEVAAGVVGFAPYTNSLAGLFVGDVNVTGDLKVGGVGAQNVCLQDGTNCPSGGGSYTAGSGITFTPVAATTVISVNTNEIQHKLIAYSCGDDTTNTAFKYIDNTGQPICGVVSGGGGGGSGDITSVIAGTGLSGGGPSGNVTLNLDAAHYDGSYYDGRFLNTSNDNSASNLTVTNLTINGTLGGTAITGLTLPWAKLTNFPSACSAGQFVTAIGETLTCATPPSGGGSGGGGISGTGTAGYLTKWSSGTVVGNSSVFDTGTNVGIGISNPDPAVKLDVNGLLRLSNGGTLSLYNAGGAPVSLIGSSGGADNLNIVTLDKPLNIVNNFTAGSQGSNINIVSDANIFLNPVNNGYVGIGTPTPTQKLDVLGNTQANAFIDRDNPLYYIDPASTGTAGIFAGNVYARYYSLTPLTTGLPAGDGIIYYNATENKLKCTEGGLTKDCVGGIKNVAGGLELLGDTAIIGEGGVGSSKIQDGSIASVDIQDGEIKTADIQDGSITSLDIQDLQINTNDLANSSVNISKLKYERKSCLASGLCSCTSGKVVGGGGVCIGAGIIQTSRPFDDDTWEVSCSNGSAPTTEVICINL